MANFGIVGLGTALSASDGADTILFQNSTATLSANTVNGLAGNDLIYIGSQGYTAVASGTSTLVVGTGFTGEVRTNIILSGSVSLVGQDVVYSRTFSTAITGGGTKLASGHITGVVTSQNAVRTSYSSQLWGAAGDDSIYLGDGTAIWSSVTVGGGAGNDRIGSISYVNEVSADGTFTAGTVLAKSFVEGGGGNDTIYFALGTAAASALTIQGGQGNDSIVFTATNSDANNINQNLILGGGGDDVITGAADQFSADTVLGGGGNDTIYVDFLSAGSLLIAGDQNLGSTNAYDGNDLIRISADDTATSFTVVAGAGNDSITFVNQATAEQGVNTFYLMAGDDILSAGANSADTVYAGAGQDSVYIGGTIAANTDSRNSLFFLGGDNDLLSLAGSAASAAGELAGNTVWGGAGADLFTASAAATTTTLETAGITFGYSANTDSTLSAMDTIAIGFQSNEDNFYRFRVDNGSNVALASFSAAGGQATGTNGVVIFSANFNDGLTARVDIVNANTTSNQFATFVAGANNTRYIFIQGGDTSSTTDDLLVQVGTAGTAALAQAAVTITNGKNILLQG